MPKVKYQQKITDNQVLGAIKRDVASGSPTLRATAKRIGLPVYRVYAVARKHRINSDYLNAQSAKIVRRAIADKVDSLEEILEKTGRTPHGLRNICEQYKLELPSDLKPYKFRPKMDRVIDRGGSLLEIGIAGGYPERTAKSNASLYLKDSFQYHHWRERRKQVLDALKKEAELRVQQEAAHKQEQIRKQIEKRAQYVMTKYGNKSPWAAEMAAEHIRSYKIFSWNSLNTHKLVKAFQMYYEAKQSGEAMSTSEIGRLSGINIPYLYRIFRVRNLESLLNEKWYKEVPAAIKFLRLGLSNRDIGYVLNVPESRARSYVKKLRNKKHAKPIVRIGQHNLTYRLAAQIYQARAGGKGTYTNIADTFKTSEDIVRFAIDNRHNIAPKLVKAFRIAYDNPHYDKPYKK